MLIVCGQVSAHHFPRQTAKPRADAHGHVLSKPLPGFHRMGKFPSTKIQLAIKNSYHLNIMAKQSGLFRGIYEFEDPSGSLVAAKIPHKGSADLYNGTAVIVRPNQLAIFVHKGHLADVFEEGTHTISSQNVPLLTKLANWRFGFKSPLRSEIWFFSTQVFTGRRWGTAKPILQSFDGHPSIPVHAFGNYNVQIRNPKLFYTTLLGSRLSFDMSELEEFVQGQIIELLPEAVASVKQLEKLNQSQQKVSVQLEKLCNKVFAKYGIHLRDVQILSLLPSQEVLQAMEAKAAMQMVGNKQEYLLYKAANSLNELGSGNSQGNDPMQMMLGLMLGKNLMQERVGTRHVLEAQPVTVAPKQMQELSESTGRFCSACGHQVSANDRFCSNCGEKLK
jgi:membrane protease subunit (stomatin/prohibitin family)